MKRPNKKEINERYKFLPTTSRLETYITALEKYANVIEKRNAMLTRKINNFKVSE